MTAAQTPQSMSPSGHDTAEHILQRVDRPIAQATGLPNQTYTSEEAFIRDRQQVMAPNWACIGFADQLPTANYVLPIDFMGLPLVATRDAEDCIRVFHNVCSHRGFKLADKPCSNNGAMRCPYHSWTYALNGSLRATPNIGGYGEHQHDEFNRDAHGLKEVRAKIWLGAIFINLSGDAPPFEEYVKPITTSWGKFLDTASLDNFIISEKESHLELTVQSNWKLPVENYLESYHLPSVHPELNRISPLDKHIYLDAFDNGAGQASLGYTRLDIDGDQLPAVPEWPENAINNAEYPALYPNTFLGIHADQLFIQYLQPVDHQTTVEHVRIFYFGESALQNKYTEHRQALHKSWKNVFDEDIFAVEGMQAGRASPAYGGGAFSPVMDEPTHHFHKWIAKRLAASQADSA